jgi:hypothetical protein
VSKLIALAPRVTRSTFDSLVTPYDAELVVERVSHLKPYFDRYCIGTSREYPVSHLFKVYS